MNFFFLFFSCKAFDFQNQPIINTDDDNPGVSRDYLPTLCLSKKNDPILNPELFHVNIILNDYHRVARSSLIESAFKFALYKLTLPRNHSLLALDDVYKQKLISNGVQVDVKKMLNHTSLITPNDLIELNNIKSGVYLVEVTLFNLNFHTTFKFTLFYFYFVL